MNKKIIVYILGRLLQVFGMLFSVPLIVSLIYHESAIYVLS